MEESLPIIKNKGECLMNNKTKKVIVIFLSLLALGLIIYTVYYLLKNNSSEENAVNVNIVPNKNFLNLFIFPYMLVNTNIPSSLLFVILRHILIILH